MIFRSLKLAFLVLLASLTLQDPLVHAADFSLADRSSRRGAQQKILKAVWSTGLKSGSPNKRFYPEASSPISDGQNTYIGTHGKHLYAINSRTGKVVWKKKHENPVATKATLVADAVVFVDLNGLVMALNRVDGSEVWRYQLDQEVLAEPLFHAGKLFFLKGEHEVLALNASSGKLVWNQFIRVYVRNMTMRGHSKILADAGRLYVGMANGSLFALQASSGKILWQKSLSVPLQTFKDIDGAMALTGNAIYVSGYYDRLYRLNKSNGKKVWEAKGQTGVRPLVMADKVVISNQLGELVAFSKSDGAELWRTKLDRSVLSEPVAYQNWIYVTSYKGYGYLVDPQSGRQAQRLGVGDGSISSPFVDGDQILVHTNNAKLIALGQR